MTIRLTATLAAFTALLLAYACARGYEGTRRNRPPESCADAAALPACEARIDNLKIALADTLASAPDQPALAEEDEGDVEQRSAHAENSAQSQASHGPDCTAARELRDHICDLSDAICALAARDGAPAEIMDKCGAARTGCERARTEVSNACPR